LESVYAGLCRWRITKSGRRAGPPFSQFRSFRHGICLLIDIGNDARANDRVSRGATWISTLGTRMKQRRAGRPYGNGSSGDGLIPADRREDFMTPRDPNDPFQPVPPADDPRSPRLDSELQSAREPSEGTAIGGRIAAFAVAIVLVFSAVFYGMNSSSLDPKAPAVVIPNSRDASSGQTAQNAPPIAPGVRDVTPRHKTESGMTTGAAPTRGNAASPPPNPVIGSENPATAPSR